MTAPSYNTATEVREKTKEGAEPGCWAAACAAAFLSCPCQHCHEANTDSSQIRAMALVPPRPKTSPCDCAFSALWAVSGESGTCGQGGFRKVGNCYLSNAARQLQRNSGTVFKLCLIFCFFSYFCGLIGKMVNHYS